MQQNTLFNIDPKKYSFIEEITSKMSRELRCSSRMRLSHTRENVSKVN